MNEKLSEEFDHFRKHDINGSFYPVESLQLLECWFKSSGISIKTIIRYGKRYFLMSAANIDAFCQWVMETRKMYNKDGGVLDSLNLASKPDLNVCASGFIKLRPNNCTTNEAKVSVNDCDEEKQQSKKTSDEEKPIKKARKVRCRKQWMEVEDVKLYEEHRCILESNKWVDDVLINASQFLLHSQYGRPGFQATTLAYNLRFNVMREFIQVLHNGEDHWVTISTIGLPSGHVNVFDSLYDTCNSFIIEQICAILCTPNDAVHLHFMDTVKQTNHSDCGLYAIAFAVDLCSGQDVCKRNYSAVLMRPHLLNCLQNRRFTPFPASDRPISSRAIAQKKSVHVRCYCRMPDAGLMIQCDSCKEWFHKECDISIPKKAWNNKKYKWNCKKCQPN